MNLEFPGNRAVYWIDGHSLARRFRAGVLARVRDRLSTPFATPFWIDDMAYLTLNDRVRRVSDVVFQQARSSAGPSALWKELCRQAGIEESFDPERAALATTVPGEDLPDWLPRRGRLTAPRLMAWQILYDPGPMLAGFPVHQRHPVHIPTRQTNLDLPRKSGGATSAFDTPAQVAGLLSVCLHRGLGLPRSGRLQGPVPRTPWPLVDDGIGFSERGPSAVGTVDREFESCRLLADFLACQLVDLGPDKHFEAVLHDLDGPRTDRTPWAYALVIGAWVYLLPAPLIFYDQRGRLHREDGPAVSWPGDLAWWYWHGVQVPRRLIEDPESITLQEILQEPNAERRRILIERRGLAWFLDRAGATVIDRDEDAGGERRLMQFNLPGEREPLMALVVRCPSTGRVYALRVPPQCGTCREAVAWTFNFPPESYRPAVET